MPVPEGAELSEDGQWWWDGANWQAVDGPQASYDTSTTSAGQLSDDGQYQWNGSEWQAVGGETPVGSATAAGSETAVQIDTTGLVQTLNAIASLDEVAVTSSSSSELDAWIASLTEWHNHLSQSQYNA